MLIVNKFFFILAEFVIEVCSRARPEFWLSSLTSFTESTEPLVRYRHRSSNKYICFKRNGAVRAVVSLINLNSLSSDVNFIQISWVPAAWNSAEWAVLCKYYSFCFEFTWNIFLYLWCQSDFDVGNNAWSYFYPGLPWATTFQGHSGGLKFGQNPHFVWEDIRSYKSFTDSTLGQLM